MPKGSAVDIRELIDATKGDRSYADLAKASGNKPTRQRWQQLHTQQPKGFPEPESIQGIAAALHVTPLAVVHAFASSFGIAIKEQSRLVELLPPGVDRLADDDVRQILALIARLTPATRAKVVPLSDRRDKPSPRRGEPKVAADRTKDPNDTGS